MLLSAYHYLMSFLLPIIVMQSQRLLTSLFSVSLQLALYSLVQYIPPNHTHAHTHTHIYPYSQKYLAEPSYLFFSPNLPLPSSSLRVIKIPMRIPSLYQLEVIDFPPPPPPKITQGGKKSCPLHHVVSQAQARLILQKSLPSKKKFQCFLYLEGWGGFFFKKKKYKKNIIIIHT